MTTFTTLTDTTLSQDKPFTQDIARAMRDNPLAIQEGDASAPRINAKALNCPFAHVQRTTSLSVVGTGFGTKIPFTTEVADPSNLYDQTLHRLTPNMEGLYRVAVNANVTRSGGTGTTSVILTFFKNGSSVTSSVVATQTATGNAHVTYETFISMNGASDYFEVYCTETSGTGTVNSANFTAIAVAKA